MTKTYWSLNFNYMHDPNLTTVHSILKIENNRRIQPPHSFAHRAWYPPGVSRIRRHAKRFGFSLKIHLHDPRIVLIAKQKHEGFVVRCLNNSNGMSRNRSVEGSMPTCKLTHDRVPYCLLGTPSKVRQGLRLETTCILVGTMPTTSDRVTSVNNGFLAT